MVSVGFQIQEFSIPSSNQRYSSIRYNEIRSQSRKLKK